MAAFIETLSRDLSPELNSLAMYTFFKKNAVLFFNLEEIDGDLMRFEATYEGNSDKVSWPGERSLFLKSDCDAALEQVPKFEEWKHRYF